MDVVVENLPLFLEGFWTTLRLAVFSGALALVLGTLLGACRVSPIPPLRGLGTVYVELARNTPLTVVFFFVVFVTPQLGLRLPFFPSAVIALTIYTAAFVCEAVRSGINSVGVGQAEAARSIGLSFNQSLRNVILPQAVRTVVPPLINIFIALTKNTSVAGGFFVAELFNVGRRLTNGHATAVTPILIGVAVFYLLITVPSGLLAGRLERKVAIAR
ncbi:amino acid ABC transporter permease [Actinopolymorpha alba]|uniref:amino acid ABC transporter permease n=1 Tax=Actinopolymorpha alba TaxID=533267 RepID=UPI0003721D0C|nr:amino acid ABC transporter permease [Actinopolymorpha alba]